MLVLVVVMVVRDVLSPLLLMLIKKVPQDNAGC